ncbi:unnamed protein product [Caenorhabditis brenneri]
MLITEQWAVAFITFSITFTGIITNLIVILAIRKASSMSGSFGIITSNQAVCNAVMCLIFLFYVFPVQISSSELLIDYSHYFGTAAMTVYEISNGSHFLIALNRFCALFLPHRYDKVFKNSTTIILRNVLWICSMSCCSFFYEFLGCNFFYNPATWTFEFSSTAYCSTLTWYSDFTFNTAATVVTLIINLLAAYKERKNSRILMDIAGIKKSVVQQKREWNFIKQTCFQGLSIFLGQFAYYIIAPIIGEFSSSFVCTGNTMGVYVGHGGWNNSGVKQRDSSGFQEK